MLRGVVLALVALGVAPFTARRLTPSAALSRTALAIPAPAKDAFALYADLPQQPKWSPQFRSVRWIDQARRESEWTLNVPIPVSFIAKDTVYDPSAKAITWQTTARSPLRASGAVRFTESDDAHACTMALSVELQAPPLLERALSTAGLNPISDASLAEDARARDELVRQPRCGAGAAATAAAAPGRGRRRGRPPRLRPAAAPTRSRARPRRHGGARRRRRRAAALARSQPASARPLDPAAGAAASRASGARVPSEPASSSDLAARRRRGRRAGAAALPPPPAPPAAARQARGRARRKRHATVSAADGGGADDEALRSESAVDARSAASACASAAPPLARGAGRARRARGG